MFLNPHSFVHMMGPDEKGQVQRWAIAWAAAGQLTDISRDTLKPGDHVIITGNPRRTVEDHRLRMRSIFRPRTFNSDCGMKYSAAGGCKR